MAFELRHPWLLEAGLARSSELFYLSTWVLALFILLRRTNARRSLTLGLCSVLGLLCTSVTFLLLA